MAYRDRVKESATVSGSSAITLTGALTEHVTFGSVFSNAALCTYCVVNTDDHTWETGIGTYNSGTNTITRTTFKSSSSGSPISFGAGTKVCYHTISGLEIVGSSTAYGIPQADASGLLDIGWLPTVTGAKGGTGVVNTGKTITLGGSLTLSGAYDLTLTQTGTTNVTLPTSGTLAALGNDNTWTGVQTYTKSAAASAPGYIYSGTFYAGTGTSSLPMFLFRPSGVSSITSWPTGGTLIGALVGNSAFATSNVITIKTDVGTELFRLNGQGQLWTNQSINSGVDLNLSTTTGRLTYRGGQTVLTSTANAVFQFGGVDASSAIGQTLCFQNISASTSNTSGADATIIGSRPTGTGTPGNIIHQTAFAGISTNSTVTISNASPAVITWASHGLLPGQPVTFTTTGTLPTGLATGTTYYVLAAGWASGSFRVSTSHGSSAVNTSSAGSGTHTCTTATTVQNPASTIITEGPSGVAGSASTSAFVISQYWNTSSSSACILELNCNSVTGSGYLIAGKQNGTINFSVSQGGAIACTAIVASGSINAAGFDISCRSVLCTSLIAFSGQNIRMAGGSNGVLNINNSTDGAISRMYFGGDAASPAATRIQANSTLAGTSNTQGAKLTVIGGFGTGTAGAGDFAVGYVVPGSTGSTQNTTIVDGLLVSGSTGNVTIAGTISNGTSGVLTTGTIELGHATANTLSASSGVLSIEGVVIPTISSTNTLTNKRITGRRDTPASSTTWAVNSDNFDSTKMAMTGTAGTITISNPTGTPTDGQQIEYVIKCTNAQSITLGNQFRGSDDLALPTAFTAAKWCRFKVEWESTDSKWDLIAKNFGF